MNLTPERRELAYQTSLNWVGFLESMKVNRQAIEANFAGFRLTPSEKEFLQTLPGVTDVLVLAHDWCGDVIANLPFFARIEAETGKIRLRIIPKDPDNVDIGRLYPHPDGDVHIPIYIFFDDQGREKGHFIERTQEITDQVGLAILQFWKENPRMEGRGQAFSDLAPHVRKALLERLGTERKKVRDQEKASILAMLGAMLR